MPTDRLRHHVQDDALSILRHHRTGLYTLALVVGLMAGAGAVAFRLGIDAWAQLLAGGAGEHLEHAPSSGILSWSGRWFVLIAPILSGLFIGPLMTFWGGTSTGHGVSGAIWAARRSDGAMEPRPAFISVVASALTIGGGGSVGPEGPIAELGASAASVVGRRLSLPIRWIRMLAAGGTAAGIAAAFNAPLAGAFFAMEVILVDFTVDAFAFVVLACVSATVLSHQVLGEAASISLPSLDLVGDTDLGWAALVGVAGGVVGVAFSRTHYILSDAVARLRERAGLPRWLLPGVGGVAIGALLFVFPQSYGESSQVLDRVLGGGYGPGALAGLAALKILATSLTLALGFAGGVFAPSLFIGGAMGACVGLICVPHHPSAAAVFGVLGMGGVFTGAVRAPITAVVLIIEMTGQYSLLLPLMLVSVLATFVSGLLTRTTIYTEALRRRGEDVDDPLSSTLVGRARAQDMMAHPPSVLCADDSLPQAAAVLYASGSALLPVVVDQHVDTRELGEPSPDSDPQSGNAHSEDAGQSTQVLLGCVGAVQIAQALALGGEEAPRTVGELTLSRERVRVDTGATAVLELLTRTQADGVPVVRRRSDGRDVLVGWVAGADMVRRLYRHQRDAYEASTKRTSLGARAQAYLTYRHAVRRR